MAKMFNIKAY